MANGLNSRPSLSRRVSWTAFLFYTGESISEAELSANGVEVFLDLWCAWFILQI
jgi:hypothetical protein